MAAARTSHASGLSEYDTRIVPLSLLYPVIRGTDEMRDVYVFFEHDDGTVTLDRHPYHRLDEPYRKQLKAVRQKRAAAFFGSLALLLVSLAVSLRYFKILLFLCLAATLYEFADRRIRYLWLRREYERARRSQDCRPAPPGPGQERSDS